MLLITSADEKSVPLLQQLAQGDPPDDDVYSRYPQSRRQVEDILFERGIEICQETELFWRNRFGPMLAAEIWKRQVHHCLYSRWRWRLDEVFVRINGEMHYVRRAVNYEGEVLEVLATKYRDHKAALKFLKRTMKRYDRPRTTVADRPQTAFVVWPPPQPNSGVLVLPMKIAPARR